MSIDSDDDRSYKYDNFGKVKFIPVYDPDYEWCKPSTEEFQDYLIKCKIESGSVDPNSVNEDGEPLWHYICQRLGDDDVDWAKWLFSLSSEKYQPVQIDARDNFGRTALHLAVYNDLERITEFLLSRDANPNSANDKGETPLHVICRIDRYGSNDIQYYNSYYGYRREVHNQQKQFVERQKRMIELLLSRGANPNAPDAKGFTPLHVVCQKKCDDDYVRIRNIKELPNLALYRNHRSVIASMLRLNADLSVANAEGSTPMHVICKGYGDNLQLAETLYDLGNVRCRPIPVDARDGKGETPLHLATNQLGNNKLVDFLLRRGADRNAVNDKGETPLHIICRRSDVQMLKKFFDVKQEVTKEVAVDAVDGLGRTPLQWAVANLNLDMINVLLDRGADLSGFIFPDKPHFDEIQHGRRKTVRA